MNFVDPSLAAAMAPTGAKTLGIRPEHCELVAPDAGTLNGTVAFCEALGADTLVHVRMSDGTLLIVRSEGDPKTEGEAVGVTLSASGILGFDVAGRAMTQ